MFSCDLIIPCAPAHQVDAIQILAYLDSATTLAAQQQIFLKFKLIIVLDGPSSTPATALESLAQALGEQFKLIRFAHNQGKGAAVKAGLRVATGKYSFYSDADLPYPAPELVKMLQALQQKDADIVLGTRQKSYYTQLPLARILISKGFACLNHLILGSHNDTQGGLKGFNRRGRWIFLQAPLNRYLFDLDALYRARFAGLRRTSVPIEIRPALQFKNYTWRNYGQELKSLLTSYGHLLFWPCLAVFFSIICFNAFWIDANQGYHLGKLVYHDYAVNIPLVRSFSWGRNFPVEYPTYTGAPIRYHYLYFLLIGLLERTGLRLDYAFNLPSILGFILLGFFLFKQTYRWFKSKLAGYLAILFFFFPGHGWISDIVAAIKRWPPGNFWTVWWENKDFMGNFPWEMHTRVSACLWNLNVYLNQRHFIWALILLLGIFYYFTSPALPLRLRHAPLVRRGLSPYVMSALFICLIGILPLWHLPSVIGLGFILLSLLLVAPATYRPLLLTGLGGAAATLLVNFTIFKFLHPQFAAHHWWHPWWMTKYFGDWLTFWAHNLSWHLIFAPLGLYAAGKARRYFLPALLIFVAGNFIQFVDPSVNQHKIFCIAALWLVPFSAWGVVWTMRQGCTYLLRRWPTHPRLWKAITLGGIIFCSLNLMRGGLYDLLPILRQGDYVYYDTPIMQRTLDWIHHHTPPNATFISNHPSLNYPLMAGRNVYYSWPSYALALGYPQVRARMAEVQRVFHWPKDPQKTFSFTPLCLVMRQQHIDYAIFENPFYLVVGDQPPYDWEALRALRTPDFDNPQGGAMIYARRTVCQGSSIKVLQPPPES